MFGLVVYSALANVDNLWWPADLDGFNLMDLASVVLATEAVRQVDHMRTGTSLDNEHRCATSSSRCDLRASI